MAGIYNNGLETAKNVKTVLETYLAAALDVIDTREADSITLDDIAKYYNAPQANYRTLPALVIVCSDMDIVRKGTEKFGFHTIQLRLIVGGRAETATLTPTEVLGERLHRSIEAIETTLDTYDKLPISGTDQADGLLADGASFNDVYETQEKGRSLFAQDALLTVQVATSA